MEINYRSFQSQISLSLDGLPKALATEQPSLTLERPRGAVGGDMDVLSCPGAHGVTPTTYRVALGAEGVVWVTGTRLAAPAAGQLPVVGSTLVTFGAHHMGQAQAAPALLFTRHVPSGPQDAAVTACRREGC